MIRIFQNQQQYVVVARNKLQKVKVSDIDLAAEFHTTPATQQTTETVPQYLHHSISSVGE